MSDIRNMVSQYAVEFVATEGVGGGEIYNVDDVTYACGPEGIRILEN